MKHRIVTRMAVGVGLTILALGAYANSININLSGAGGSPTYTSGGVTFTGWENLDGTWLKADLSYKANGPNETGLGVVCTYSSGNKCGQHEINTVPWQVITVNLSGGQTEFSSLSLGVGSVDSGGGNNRPETAFLLDAVCGALNGPFPGCNPSLLAAYTYNGVDRTHLFTFSPGQLESFIWVTPKVFDGGAPDGNVLLASLSYNLPEPSAFGIFGLGLLMVGLLVSIRRRAHGGTASG